jgi:hypothetical protein
MQYRNDQHKALGDPHRKPAAPKPKVDIGTAVAINRNGPVKPGTNTPLAPKKLPGRQVLQKKFQASLKWK